jgi:hypothetical protein
MKAIVIWLAQTRVIGGLPVPNVTAWLVGIIVLLTVLLLAYFGAQFIRVWKDLHEATRKVRSLKHPLRAREYPELNAFFRSRKVLAAAWNEFDETLYKPDPATDPDASVLNSRQAEDFINQRTVFAHSINTDFCSAVPGMLTALGLLGTFVSIFAALSLLQINNGSISEIQPFINNLSGKFISSIAGIGGAFIFLFFEKLLLGAINNKCHALQSALNAVLTLSNQDTGLKDLSDRMLKIENLLETLGNNLPGQLKQAFETAVADAVGVQMNELLDSAKEVKRLTEENLTQRQDSITRLVTLVVQSFRDALAEAANDEILKLTDGLKNAGQTVEHMNTALSGTLVQYEKAIESQRRQIDAFLTDNQVRAQTWSEQQQKHFEDFSRCYQDQINALTQTQSEQLETQMKAVQSSSEDLLRSFERASSLFQQKVNSNVEALVTRVEVSSDSQLKELKSLVEYILKGVESWAGSAQNGLSSVLNQAELSAGRLEQTVKSLDSALSTLNRSVTQLTALETSIGSNKKSISDLTTAMEGVAQSVASAMQGVRQSLDEFARQSEAQGDLFVAQERLWLNQKSFLDSLEAQLLKSQEVWSAAGNNGSHGASNKGGNGGGNNGSEDGVQVNV